MSLTTSHRAHVHHARTQIKDAGQLLEALRSDHPHIEEALKRLEQAQELLVLALEGTTPR